MVPRPPPLLANASRSILAVVLVVCISMLEHHEAFFLYRATYCACSLFTFVFFLTEKTKHVDAEKQANKKKHIFTIINDDDDDDARLFLDLFSRLFSVRIFHANYRSAQLCETTAKISSSP